MVTGTVQSNTYGIDKILPSPSNNANKGRYAGYIRRHRNFFAAPDISGTMGGEAIKLAIASASQCTYICRIISYHMLQCSRRRTTQTMQMQTLLLSSEILGGLSW